MNSLEQCGDTLPHYNRYDFGVALIRPDAMELGLDEPILARIEQAGLLIAERSISVITDEQIDEMYPHLHDKPYYQPMKDSMVGRKVMPLIIYGDQPVETQLLELKGSAGNFSGSLRADFSAGHLLSGDLYDRFANGTITDDDKQTEEWKAIKRDDRIHTDESPEEAANSIRVMFSTREITEAVSRFPQLQRFLALNN